MTAVNVRDATAADAAAVLALNNANTPHVNALTAEEFAWLASHAVYHRVATDETGVIGFALCLAAGLEYWSENYKWFAARYAEFLYLDRVVVASHVRRLGVGRALYADLHRVAGGRWPRVTLEVNVRPANPTSVAFHEALGYEAVGVREYDDGEHAVQMYCRTV
jgi:predicted GNAT superfamily acetyltransferase